jgi:hypothetical protein
VQKPGVGAAAPCMACIKSTDADSKNSNVIRRRFIRTSDNYKMITS